MMPTTNDGIIIPFPASEEELQNKVIQVTYNGVIQEITIPWWVISPETEKRKRELLANQFFLLRQGELGELLKCTRCGTKHRYFTLMCIERPFDGLKEGLLAYYHHVGKYGGEKFLSSIELRRYEEIGKVVGRIGGQRDLSDGHPQTARTLKTGDNDYDIGAVSLGLLEPITARKAEALAWNINARGLKPPFRLQGLERTNAPV